MRRAESLRRRIVAAFVLFGVVLSVFFAALAVVAVEGIEVYLVDQRLADVRQWVLPRDAAGLEVDLPAGLSFHRGDNMPRLLRGLPDGISEVLVDGITLHVLAGTDARGAFVIVDHESDYNKVERLVYVVFGACFAGFLVLAIGLGRFVSSWVVTPMRTLADAVARGATSLPLLERTDELGTLARALDAHTRELREFLDRERFFTGDVSHELRTPLSVIMGAAEVLLASHEDAAIRAPAQRIYRAAQQAAECVTVLLLLARAPELGSLPCVSVSDIARREVDRLQPMVAGKPVQLRCAGDADIRVRAPAELCAAAIGNLVRNACQYTDQGSVTVMLEPARIVVEDTGPGLPDAVRRLLQENVTAIPSRDSAGTGLGLSLVKRIGEYLGASLDYTPRPGGGSRFTITFV